jgi:hypothetical protein
MERVHMVPSISQVIAVFEGLHQGRILCASVADDTTLLTAGESTVRTYWDVVQTLAVYSHLPVGCVCVGSQCGEGEGAV